MGFSLNTDRTQSQNNRQYINIMKISYNGAKKMLSSFVLIHCVLTHEGLSSILFNEGLEAKKAETDLNANTP